jgi:HAE1 family hydrophobic/amphiphilic exporter-1
MTTIIVFVPFVFMSQSSFGIFMRDFGIAVSLALVSSLVVSLTVVPMISSLIYKGEERPKKRLIVWLTETYGRFMHWTLRWRYGLVLLLIPLLWASFSLFQAIERQEMPSVPARELRVNVLMPSIYTMAEMTDLFERIEKIVQENKEEFEVDTFSTEWGKNNRNRNRYRGELDLFFTETGDKLTAVPELQEKVLARLPQEIGVEYQVGERRHFGHGRGGGISIELRGDNQDILALYAEKVKERLMQMDDVSDVTTDMESGDQELHFKINRDKAEKLGLSSRSIAQTISAALSERATTRYQTENGEVDVIVRFEESRRRTQDDILNLDVATPGGELVPLNNVVQPVFASGPQVIRKENRKRIVTISANTERQGMMWIMSGVNDLLADLKLPDGYSWQMGRSFSRFQQDQETQSFAIWLALVFIFMVMASLFESWIHPVTILFTVPFAITGISIVFWVTNTQLDRNAWLGIALLCGLVVNNAIILVDHINSLRRQGNRRREAIIQGGKDRLRPIMMTALSTMFGMVPMILPVIFPDWFGVVSYRARQWSPIALALFGGLTTSTFLTLIILPLIYNIVDDLREWGLSVVRRAADLGKKASPTAEKGEATTS